MGKLNRSTKTNSIILWIYGGAYKRMHLAVVVREFVDGVFWDIACKLLFHYFDMKLSL